MKPVHQKLALLSFTDYDRLFYETPNAHVIEYEKDNILVKDQMLKNKQLFFKDGSKDLSNIATCECGKLTGNYMEGQICPDCKTVVKTNFVNDLVFHRWLEISEEFPPLLHPSAYRIIESWLGPKSGILPALLNPKLKLPAEHDGKVGQGFDYFSQNFDNIIHYFAHCKKFSSPAMRPRTEAVLNVIRKLRPLMFIRHIPALDNSLHLSTKNGSIHYGDGVVTHIINAKLELCQLMYVHAQGTYNKNYVNERLFAVYNCFLKYTEAILKDKLLQKKGLIRKQVLGARMQCTARAVIIPIAAAHQYDEIYIPWAMAVRVLSEEIINVCINRLGMSGAQAEDLCCKAKGQFIPQVYDIINTLIEECPYKGLPVMMGRNPSLRLGAIFLLFATKVKKDFNDTTVSISALCSSAPNYDFDGDAMHLLFIKEMGIVPDLMHIHPCNVLVSSSETMVSSDIQITEQAALAINAWMLDETQFDLTA